MTDPAQSTLDESEDLALRDAFDDAPFEFWIRDASGRCIVQNAVGRKWGNILGLQVDETPLPPEILAAWRANNERAYAGELVQNEVEYLVAGQKLYYQCVVVPIRRKGQVQGILGFNIDVTDRKRAEEALRESERRLRAALRIARMGYLDWDLVTNEIKWSPETYRLFGYTPGEFTPTIEATIGMVVPEDLAFVQERLDGVIRGTHDYDIDHRVVRFDGEVIHIHAQGEVMRDEHGKALRMLGTVVDITERRRAEAALRISEERLKQALSAASAGMWENDLRTGQLHWSSENFALYQRDPARGQLTYEDWLASIHPDDRPSAVAAVRDAIAGRTAEYRAEFRVPLARGGERWVLARGQVQRAADGTPLRLLGISIDITARKHAEDKLREVDRRRTDFLGVLSHELRNPLAAIHNSLYVLEHVDPGAAQARRAIAIIDRQSHHLARLVDDLLDITRISSGKIRLQHARLDLVELVRRAVEDHRELLASRELVMTLPSEAVWIEGDATRLSQVVDNLLSNAAKFTSENGKVSVSLATSGQRAVLEVADSGVGIDPETLGQLFVPFMQADRSLDRTRGGLGLGLALVKTLVELHSGEVSARSEGPGRGACFTVQFPLDNSSAVALNGPRPHAGTSQRKVLVIEDNVDAAETLAEVLALSGHEVVIAFDGAAGLAKAREFGPDVILCDIGLPGELDGYAVAHALQDDAALASAHRIALTGYAQPEDREKTREAGFEAHFAKPPDLVALMQLLADLPTIVRA